MSRIAPIMPEILRWAKISQEEDHDDIMMVCFGILSWIGAGETPKEFKTSLPEIVDLMLGSDKYSQLFCKPFYRPQQLIIPLLIDNSFNILL